MCVGPHSCMRQIRSDFKGMLKWAKECCPAHVVYHFKPIFVAMATQRLAVLYTDNPKHEGVA